MPRGAKTSSETESQATRGTGRGRGRGRGRGASGASSQKTTARKRKAPTRECLLLLLDISETNNEGIIDGKTGFEHAKNVADWILTRKIFAESDTYIAVGCHPAASNMNEWDEVYEKTQFFSNEFQLPTVDILKRITQIQPEADNFNLIQALEGVAEMIEQGSSASFEDNVTIAVLSNFATIGTAFNQKRVQDLANRLNSLNISLQFIGHNPEVKIEDPNAFHVVEHLTKHCDVESQPFETALNQVSFFGIKPKGIRGQPFQFQLSPDFAIDVQMFVKISEEKFIPKFNMVTDNNEEVSKIRQFEYNLDEVKIEEGEPVADEPGEKIVFDKSHVIKGYHYGTSIIPFSDADKELAKVEKEGKQLQLVMFTKEENVLPHYLMTNCRWFLPNKKSEISEKVMKSLVEIMIKEKCVALVRYAYNVVSNPRLAVLYPKLTKNGCPIFEHFNLPFNEDFRGFQFPNLEKICDDPTDFQIDTIDAYIDHFMLTTKIKDDDKKTKEIERLKCKDIRNPQSQHVCLQLKKKILGLSTELTNDENEILLSMITTPNDLLKTSEKIMENLAQSFDLKINERKKDDNDAGFYNKSLAAMKALNLEFKQPDNYDEMDLEIPKFEDDFDQDE